MTPSAANIKAWRENPRKFVWDNFRVEPDAWQGDVLDVFPSQDPDKMRISLQACVGPGKSTVLSWCGWNFLTCYGEPGEHPKGAAVAVTADNLKDNLWAEFSKWQGRSEFLLRAFKWTAERIFAIDHPSTWFLSARSYSKTANADEQGRTLSGLHSKFVLVLMDESGEIPVAVAKAAEQILSSCSWAKIMQAGNPTSHNGILYAAATSLRHLWHLIRITSDPDDPKRTPRVSAEWARGQIETYGRDNPWVMSSILGLFPPSSINALLGPNDVEPCLGRHLTPDAYDTAQKRLGIDVARFGADRTVIFPRQGLAAFRPAVMRNARNPEIAARAILAKTSWGSEIEAVDGTGGWGGGVIDFMIQGGYSPLEINASGGAPDNRYANMRAWTWFKMAEWVRRGAALPNMPELAKELCAPTYTFKNGAFLLEPKDQIKKRLGYSPDLADALALTFALPEMPAGVPIVHPSLEETSHHVIHDYDPFSDERF